MLNEVILEKVSFYWTSVLFCFYNLDENVVKVDQKLPTLLRELVANCHRIADARFNNSLLLPEINMVSLEVDFDHLQVSTVVIN